MKERPILFSGPMVRALLDGSKTMTRRLVKASPVASDLVFAGGKMFDLRVAHHVPLALARCPYGVSGDRLWVRETWRSHDLLGTAYRADYDDFTASTWRWKPAIHMLRTSSRIDLQVTAVRVERLQDITEEDARAEGVEPDFGNANTCAGRDYRRSFERLWDAINGKRAAWASNPWVWVVSLKRVCPNAAKAPAIAADLAEDRGPFDAGQTVSAPSAAAPDKPVDP